MEQVRALNALEPFLALAKSANSPRAASDLIIRATSQPTTFVFAELLLTPQIQALSQSPDHSSYLTLLQIFSYGTYTTYTTSSEPLPKLNDTQLLKLRQLTLLTLARSPANLTYKNLLKVLELNSSRALEDLVITCIYAGLIEAKLDPYNQIISISSVAPLRDLAPGSVPTMITTFHAWSNRCSLTLNDLEHQISSIKHDALMRKREEIEWQQKLDDMIDSEKEDKAEGSWDKKGKMTTRSNNGSGMINALGDKADGMFGGFGGGSSGNNGKRGMGMGMDEDMGMDLDEAEAGEGRGGKQKKRYAL